MIEGSDVGRAMTERQPAEKPQSGADTPSSRSGGVKPFYKDWECLGCLTILAAGIVLVVLSRMGI
jgi:hypothetical protein